MTALDGTTIEINNTDAEGRLVLADCITYARREGAERIVDIATLTGGVVAALGNVHAGLLSNDDALGRARREPPQRTGELVWRLPLHERYAEMVKGRYARADQPLRAPRGDGDHRRRTAGALRRRRAVGAHRHRRDRWDVKTPYIADAGATGFGVRLLVEIAWRRRPESAGLSGRSPAGS